MDHKKSTEKLEPKHNLNPNPDSQSGSEPDKIASADAHVKSALAELDSSLDQPLPVKQSRELLKPRNAVWRIVPQVVALTDTRPSLVPIGVDGPGLATRLDLVTRLQALLHDVNGLQARLEATVRTMESQLYKDVLDIYSIASRGRGDATVDDVVSEMRAALANGPRYPRVLRTPLAKPTHVVIPAPRPTVTFGAPAETGGQGSSQAQPSQPTAAPAAAPAAPASTSASSGGGTAGSGLNGSSALASNANGAAPVTGG